MTIHLIAADGLRYELEAPEGDWIGEHLRTGRPYEHKLLRVVSRLISPEGGCIVDVGANIGNHTVYWALRTGATIHAFEANPAAVEILRKNLGAVSASTVIVHSIGLGSERSRADVVSEGGEGSDLGGRRLSVGSGSIEVDTLDAFGLDIDVIKIDVEGMEADVLRGATQTLRRSRPYIVVEENDPVAIRERLRELRYRRLPVNLAATPTFLYAPDWRAFLRAATRAPYASNVKLRTWRLLRWIRRKRV